MIYKKTLNKLYWKDFKFDKSVRIKILKIVEDFLKNTDSDFDIEDVKLTGSLANYTYNKYSDLDVHIVVDFNEINKDKKIVKEALDGKRFIWNLRHNIFIKGHEVELYFEDKNEQHISSGIYSLMYDKWVKKPEYNPPKDINNSEVETRVFNVTDIVNRMSSLLSKTTDKKEIKLIYNKASKIKEKIIKVRGAALEKEGEFAVENLVFKKLRNLGIIEKLIDVINNAYDKFFTESLSFNKTVNIVIK